MVEQYIYDNAHKACYMTIANHEITYHRVDSSPALNEDINRRLEKLEHYSSDIQHVRVVIDLPHNHKHKGKLFHVAIEMSMKGSMIPVSHDDASVHVAVKHAFEAAERQLKSHSEKSSPRHRNHTSVRQID